MLDANGLWYPEELIIHKDANDYPETQEIIRRCQPHLRYSIKYTSDGRSNFVKSKSEILREFIKDEKNDVGKDENNEVPKIDSINAGKRVLFVMSAAKDEVEDFDASDSAFVCPTFKKIAYASNGCFFKCDWCFLKGTYGAQSPYITVRVPTDDIKNFVKDELARTENNVLFNAGELADALSLEHITGAARTFIPFFTQTKNGYLFLLTKSDKVDIILDDPTIKEVLSDQSGKYNKDHIIFAWSINNDEVSAQFENVAPTSSQRLSAAKRVQDAGFRIRLRLDPIVPVEDWREKYASTIESIFNTHQLNPERITIGTIRFSEPLYNQRNSGIFKPELTEFINDFKEMKYYDLKGKYSFKDNLRYDMFKFVMSEIRKYKPDIDISMCKESESLWQKFKDEANGSDKKLYDIENMKCVCILDKANGKYKPGIIYNLDFEKLKPDENQPRKIFDIDDLALSIKKKGILVPLLFRVDDNNNLIIVAGGRRYAAVKKINAEAKENDKRIETLPCMYINNDPDLVAIIDNLQRENLNPVEEAQALQTLIDKRGVKPKGLEKLICKSQSTISEILSINKLPKEILDECIKDDNISRRFLVGLAKFKDEDVIKKQFKKAKKYGYSSTILKGIYDELHPSIEASTNETTRTPNYYSLARGSVKTLKSYFERLAENEDAEEATELYGEYEQMIPFVKRVFSRPQIDNLIQSLQEQETETEETE